jgi:hypothetical protein
MARIRSEDKDPFVRFLRKGMDAMAIADASTVSIQMANFRLRVTGAERQVAGSRR